MYCKVLRKGRVLSAFLLIQAAVNVLPPLRPPHVLPEAAKQRVEGIRDQGAWPRYTNRATEHHLRSCR